MNDKISIVVPVYNVAAYLEDCVASLTRQTYTNLEIILVDDGSTDGSGDLADQLAESDSRIQVYHKANGGLSETRNYGTERATGDWIMYCDSDDAYDLNAVALLVACQAESGADLVATPVRVVYSSEPAGRVHTRLTGRIYDKREALVNFFCAYQASVSQCGKLMKTDLARKNPNPPGKYYEDLAVISGLVRDAERICLAKEPVYNYYRREDSIIQSTFSPSHLDFFEIMAAIKTDLDRQYPDDREMEDAWRCRYIQSGNIIAISMFSSKEKALFQDYIQTVRPFWKSVLFHKKLSRKQKMKYLLLVLSPHLYLASRESYIKIKKR